jgi:transcriptional regulator with XRE-family HTH domain
VSKGGEEKEILMAANSKNQRDEQRKMVGRRIRRRRLFLKLTQGALARALGVSFQLIQKYEAGRTRVPAHRLEALCRHLDVAMDYFALDKAAAGGAEAEALEYFVLSHEGIALYRAIAALPDADVRARLVMAVSAFCDSHIRPEDREVKSLARWLGKIAAGTPGGQQKKAAEAAIRGMKIEIARMIGATLSARKLTQAYAAEILKTDQARISALARGHVEGSSLEKLLRFLLLLGWDAGLALNKRPLGKRGKLEITAS